MAIFTLVKCEWTSEISETFTPGAYFVYEAFINMKSDNPLLLTYVGGLEQGAVQSWSWAPVGDVNGVGGKVVAEWEFDSYEALIDHCLDYSLAFVYKGLCSAL